MYIIVVGTSIQRLIPNKYGDITYSRRVAAACRFITESIPCSSKAIEETNSTVFLAGLMIGRVLSWYVNTTAPG